MGALAPSDVKRWDVDAIHAVFQTASGRAANLHQLGESLDQARNVLADWHGEAADAFRVDLGKTRRDIDADGAESRQVATAVSRAEADVRACKAELDDIQRGADANGWAITRDWRIDVGDTGIGLDPIGFAAEQQALQDGLNACKVHAHDADHELATAIRGAVDPVQLDATGNPPSGGSPPQRPPNAADPQGMSVSVQDMLVPTGAGGDDPAHMPESVEDTLMPIGAGAAGPGYTLRSLKDLLLPSDGAQPSDRQPLPGNLPDLLSRLQQPVAPGAPPPQLKPAEVESLKATARQIMADSGMPPDQIEARLDEYVANAQQWQADGGPHYVAPEAPHPPPPGLAEGFADRWFATEQRIKDLTGQDGLRALGDSWGGMAKDLGQKAEEYATQGPVAGINDLTSEFQNFLDAPSPAYYAGEKAADGAVTLPGMLFGGEGAGLAELGEIDAAAAYDGLNPLPHTPIGFDSPIHYHTWAPSAGQDLFSAFVHGEPTAGLSQQLADMSTHYIGDNLDRVILGKWHGQDDGYIGEARGQGGIYYDTGTPTWDAIGQGLSREDVGALGWQVNERFLRTQMEQGVSRIDYILDPEFSSVEEVLALDADSFSAREIAFLKSNAEAYGYQQVGDSWVRVVDGQK